LLAVSRSQVTLINMRIRARHYATGNPTDLLIENGRISSVGPCNTTAPNLEAGWVAPALFDLQINGCDGYSFNSERLTIDSIRHVAEVCRRHGIGAFCPTLVTNSFEALQHGMTTIRRACETESHLDRALPAIHLEGPYLSAEDGPRGAHPKQHIRPPDWNEFQRLQEAAGRRIHLITLAPELDGAIAFIEKLVKHGVVVSLGHTAASAPCIRDAIRAGARLSTHLGNGSHALLPRHHNYIWEQLAADELWASLICDGHHLPEAVIRCFLRVKTPARSILTCDAGSLAGLPPGRYREWDQELEILQEGKIVVPDTPYLAGSWSFTDACVANAVRLGGVSLRDAIDMASSRPRQLLDLPVHSLNVGDPADVILFDWEPGKNLEVRHALISGQTASEPAA
jgi:N-acetylglucosamine-6-phosphate deacetylase